MAEVPGRELFAQRVGGQLAVDAGAAAAVALHVEGIQDFGAADGTRFSVFLTGPGEPFLPQGTYQVTAGDGQAFELFLVPIARERDGYRYEAAFNRDSS